MEVNGMTELDRMVLEKLKKPLEPMPSDRLFFGKLIAWVDAHNTEEKKLPYNRKRLWEARGLDLSGSGITEIPEALGKLTNLTELDLQNNQLTEIPEVLGKLTNLTLLMLSNNQLTEIPECLSKLTHLTALTLNNNQLTEIPEYLSKLTNLTVLDLSNNQLTEIPECLSKLTHLTELYLSDNQLTGIPEALGKLTNLTVLDLNNNQLTEIPEYLSKLTHLTELHLSDNQLTEIPEALGKPTNLTWLDLNNNQLTEIPECLNKLTHLTTLTLSNNQLTEIPEYLSKLTNLTSLFLHNNQLTEIPECLSKLTNLTKLLLNNNQLTEIPEALGKLTNLTWLCLNDNQLTEIPDSIGNLTQLKALYLSGNYLTSIPDCVLNLANLEIIGLDSQKSNETSHIPSPAPTAECQHVDAPLPNPTEQTKMTFQQKILFGSPGTGKSHQIDHDIIPYQLDIDSSENPENVIKTVFHPEYTYGDFIGKLVPITRSGKVEYNFYEGHFLKALAQAYKNIIAAHDKQGNKTADVKNVALVIDEINRGNSAAIFGTTFQLLDRNPDGWSSYCVGINEITFIKILELIDVKFGYDDKGNIDEYRLKPHEGVKRLETLQEKLKFLNFDLINRTLKIPPNLSILASMNTSDSSIYYMDSAFKRRWDWEFIDIDANSVSVEGIAFQNRDEWISFVGKLNTFIKSNHKYIRGIEDKQIGHYFITDVQIKKSSIQNKLMFFLWDSVFNRDKKPLINLLFGDNKDDTLITFGDFAKQVDVFIDKIRES